MCLLRDHSGRNEHCIFFEQPNATSAKCKSTLLTRMFFNDWFTQDISDSLPKCSATVAISVQAFCSRDRVNITDRKQTSGRNQMFIGHRQVKSPPQTIVHRSTLTFLHQILHGVYIWYFVIDTKNSGKLRLPHRPGSVSPARQRNLPLNPDS